jgi:hypothetical protein
MPPVVVLEVRDPATLNRYVVEIPPRPRLLVKVGEVSLANSVHVGVADAPDLVPAQSLAAPVPPEVIPK